MKINDLLTKSKKILHENKIEEASLKARLLLSYILGVKKESLTAKGEEELPKTTEADYMVELYRLAKGYPLDYIIGKKEFMKLQFKVTEDTLIPRPDTEILVEEVLSLSKGGETVLDLCTGTGAIGISLSKYGNYKSITITDISKNALQISQKNAKSILGENNNINLLESNLFENIVDTYDIIVSNPPYIKTEEIQAYGLKYEPVLALDGGKDGLVYYRKIIEEAHKHLTPNGILALEIGYNQAQEVIELIKQNKNYKDTKVKKDLNGNDRVITLRINHDHYSTSIIHSFSLSKSVKGR